MATSAVARMRRTTQPTVSIVLAALLLASLACGVGEEKPAGEDKLIGKLNATMTGTSEGGTYIGTNVHETAADLALIVNSDRSITGTAHLTYSFHGEGRQSCGPSSSKTEPVGIDLPVTGSLTDTGIVFRINTEVPIKSLHRSKVCGRPYQDMVDITSSARISIGDLVLDYNLKRNGSSYSGEFHQTDKWPNGGATTTDWAVQLQPDDGGAPTAAARSRS